MNIYQNSQYLWNIHVIMVFVSRRSIWVLLEVVCRWAQQLNNKIDQEKHTIEQIIFYLEPHDNWIYYVNIDLRHQLGISVSKSQTFILVKTYPVEGSLEKWLFLQTTLCTEGNSTQNEARPFDICVKTLVSIAILSAFSIPVVYAPC